MSSFKFIFYVKWKNENEEEFKYFKIFMSPMILDEPLLCMNI